MQPGAQPSSFPQSSADRANVENINKRLSDVEAQLSKLSPGGVLIFQSESGSEILLDEKFDRPVAFGIRTVRYDFSGSTAPATAAMP
jgi:hypothetical protein